MTPEQKSYLRGKQYHQEKTVGHGKSGPENQGQKTAERLAKERKSSLEYQDLEHKKEYTMADNYRDVIAEVERRLASLVAKQADLSEADAWSAVFKADPQLYRLYREASEAEPPPPSPRTRSTPGLSPVEAEIELRTQTRLAKSAGLSQVEALREVFHEDPDLYQRYRQQGEGQRETPAPSPDAPLPAWQPPDPTLTRFIPADVQRAVLKAALALEPTNARRGLQRVRERLTALHDA